MTNKDYEILDIIKASLWSEIMTTKELTEDVKEELRSQTVEGLATAVFPDLINEKYSYIANYARMIEVQNRVIRVLSDAGIACVVLKGTAAGIYYPQPYLRVYGDIDVLVHPDNYQSAILIMSEKGFEWKGSFGKIETSLYCNGFTIEIHQSAPGLERVVEGKEIHKYLVAGLDKIEIGLMNNPKCEFPMLPWRQNGLELIWHIREHLYNGLGLRQIIDWMMFTDHCLKTEKEYKEFHNTLEQTGLTNLAKILTRMCQIYLGLDSSIKWCSDVDENLCVQLMDYVMEQGNFGNKKRDEKVTKALTRYNNTITIVRKLQEEGLNAWPTSRKYKIFFPFAWIYAAMKISLLYLNTPDRKRLVDSMRLSRKRRLLFDQIYGPDYKHRNMKREVGDKHPK